MIFHHDLLHFWHRLFNYRISDLVN